jgi:uncharacterized protein with GYD domain
MATYLVLFNLTEQGVKDIKSAPERIRRNAEATAARGAKVVSWYLTMGQYDAAAVIEAPNDETLASGLLALGTQGNVRSTTLRAFSLEEFEKIVGTMP